MDRDLAPLLAVRHLQLDEPTSKIYPPQTTTVISD
jgi:hypothetical protein